MTKRVLSSYHRQMYAGGNVVIAAAGALDWPRDRLHIQILDDSTSIEIDESTQLKDKRNFLGLVSEQSLYNLDARTVELEVKHTASKPPVLIISRVDAGGGAAPLASLGNGCGTPGAGAIVRLMVQAGAARVGAERVPVDQHRIFDLL